MPFRAEWFVCRFTLGAVITSYGLSFILLALLALTEISILITFSRRAKETR
jgi:hypothetical protein